MMPSKYLDIFWVLLIGVLAAIPFREGFIDGVIVGAGPDVVSTLWGMWWFQQEGMDAILGKHTTLVNFPYGAMGIVLSPTSAILWALLEPIVGIGRALALVNWIQIAGFAWGTMWFARVCKVERPWHVLAGLSVLCARFLIFSTGEASIVAVVALGLPLGLGALVLGYQKSFGRYHVLLIFSAIWLALENPYLAPVLPGLQALMLLFDKQERKSWLGSCILTAMGILSVAHAYGAAANPDYPREVASQFVMVFGQKWSVVDLPWARLDLLELLTPRDVAWTTSTQNAISAGGGRYLGILPFLMSLWALKDRYYRWLWILGVFCIVLCMGSVQYNLAMPFLFLNDIMDKVARPLTQPTRLLVVSLVAFGVCVAWGFQELSRKYKIPSIVIALLMLIEGFAVGGLGLRPPNTELPVVECEIPGDGGVLVYPQDSKDGELGISRLLQMSHEHPAPQHGIASWKLADKNVMQDLRGAGFMEGVHYPGQFKEDRLYRLGFTHVLVEKGENFPVGPLRFQDCGETFRLVVLEP